MEKLHNLTTDLERYKREILTPEGREKSKREYEHYLKVDCSKEKLTKEIINKYGKNPIQLREDDNFNIWEAYTFLKKYTGISKVWFEDKVYKERMSAISDVLGI